MVWLVRPSSVVWTPQLDRSAASSGVSAVHGTVRVRNWRHEIPSLLTALGTFVRDRIASLRGDGRDDRPSIPLTAVDDADRTITYRAYRSADRDGVVEMYAEFPPEQRAQGVPPLTEPGVRDWLEDVMDGPNVIAIHGDRVVGHVMFVPDDTDRHEFAIFVDPAYQGAGVGTTLARAGLRHAERQGVGYVWLSVGATERGLQSWYGSLGFSTVNSMGIAHRMSRTL